ncbi:hypothetical protein HID58_093503, partial [Brassica napus]
EEDGREISVFPKRRQPLPPPCLSFVRSFAGLLPLPQIVKLLSSVDESKTVINSKDDEGWAPLHSAASIGKGELVEILLTRVSKNNGGGTALHYAASKGWLEIAQLYFKSDERVPTELKKAIMQARGEKKLTHSKLAQKP